MNLRRVLVLLAACAVLAACEISPTEEGGVDVQPDTGAEINVGPDGVEGGGEGGEGGGAEGGEGGEGGEAEGGD